MGDLIPGYDVSHYQAPTIHSSRGSDRFVFIKATDGLGRDAAMLPHHAAAGHESKARGPYHFYRARRDPEAQADYFHATTHPYQWELPHVIDYEDASGPAHPDDLYRCLVRLESLTSRTPIVYTGPFWWRTTINSDPRFARFPLWLAKYPHQSGDTNSPPPQTMPPAPAPWAAVSIWQWTSSAGNLDRNVMPAQVLAQFLHPSNLLPPIPPTPTPPTQGPLMALTDAEQDELLAKVRDLHSQWIGNKTTADSEVLRQILKEIRANTNDIASGKRPAK